MAVNSATEWKRIAGVSGIQGSFADNRPLDYPGGIKCFILYRRRMNVGKVERKVRWKLVAGNRRSVVGACGRKNKRHRVIDISLSASSQCRHKTGKSTAKRMARQSQISGPPLSDDIGENSF